MRNALERRVAGLRGRVRRQLAIHGAGWMAAGLLAAALALGLADWAFHLAWEVRAAALVVLVAWAGWLAWKYVLAPLIVPFDDLDVALKIERRWPGLYDRLSSALEFLAADRRGEPDDGRLGSKALRQATVDRALEESAKLDLREVIDPRPARRAALAALAVIGLVALPVVLAPALTRIAVDRMFLGSTPWPRQTKLLVASAPAKVARGDPFALEVGVVQGYRTPRAAKVTYRFDDGETAVESLRPDDRSRFFGRIESVSRPFRFYVSGGDDATAWRRVEVVPPPALASVALRLAPPAYTGIPAYELGPGLTQIKAVEGTVVTIDAVANKPLAAVAMHRGDESGSQAPPAPTPIAPTGRTFTTEFPLAESGPFWFALTDTEGFKNREAMRFEARSLRDEAPRVALEEPVSDRSVPAGALVPVRIAVDDDYGIALIRLAYKIAAAGSTPTAEEIIPLWEGEPAGSGSGEAGPTKKKTVEHPWDLAPLKLEPGTVISFLADARDYDAIAGPNVGKSRELRLRIVTDEEFARQLDDQQREIREAAERLLEMQRQALAPVNDARTRLEQGAEQLPAEVRDGLRTAELVQRQVGGQIGGPTEGLDRKIRDFLEDLKNSRRPNPDAQAQMEAMQQGVNRLTERHVRPAEQGVARAAKAAEAPAGDPQAPAADPPAAEGQAPADATPSKGAQARPKSGQPKGATPKAKDAAGDPAQGDPAESGDAPEVGAEPQPGQPQGDPSPKPGRPSPIRNPKSEIRNPTAELQPALDEAQENQQAIADELEKMLEGLSQFETLRGVTQEAEKLLERQDAALKESAAAAARPELTGKAPDELTPEQRADLQAMANRQEELAGDTQGLQERLAEMAERIDQADPLAAAALREAAEQAQKGGTASKMGEAADQLARNQVGSGRQQQQEAKEQLEQLVDSLKNRRENDLARLVKELKAAEAEMKAAREKQAQTLEKTRNAQQMADPKERAEELQRLAKEEEENRERVERQLQRLRKLRAEAAAQAGSRAAGKMAKAQQGLEQDQGDEAAKNEEEALADLQQAERETRKARREAEEQLAVEQLAKIADSLRALGERQDKILEETTGYDARRAEAGGSLTRAQGSDVRALGRVQNGLKEETLEITERLAGAAAFALTLKRAGDDMESAAKGLAALKTGDDTQADERAASRRFKQLLEALKPDKADGQNGGQQQGGEGEAGEGGPPADGIPALAELKLLKALQQEINDRTDALDQASRRRGNLTDPEQAELERLQDDQRLLADLTRDLTQPKRADGEED